MPDLFNFHWEGTAGKEFGKDSDLYRDMRAEADFICKFIYPDGSFYERIETILCFVGAADKYRASIAADELRARSMSDPLTAKYLPKIEAELFPQTDGLKFKYFRLALPKPDQQDL